MRTRRAGRARSSGSQSSSIPIRIQDNEENIGMTIQVSAFRWVPPFAQGFVRDLRVRWALEEAGLAHDVSLVDRQIVESERCRLWQPFGQIPAYRDDDVELFESGAIGLHIAGKSDALSPPDEAGRLRMMAWVI